MTGVILPDETSIHFDQEKYRIFFEGMEVHFHLRKEFASVNRPKTMMLDYRNMTYTQIYADGFRRTETFTGMM